MSSAPPQKEKKKLTYAQRKRRHDIKRAIFFTVCALILFLVIWGIVKLVSWGIGAITGDSTGESVMEEVSPSPLPTLSPTPEPARTATVLAVGDNLIHDTVYEYAEMEDGTYDFTEIYSYLKDEIAAADLACIQQETIFVKDPSLYSNYPAFGTPDYMADSLAALGFDVVCHASNHTYDKVDTGVYDTLEKWKEYPQVTVLGIHESQADAETIQVVEKNGIRIALFNYTYGLNYSLPSDGWLIDFIDESHRDGILAQINAVKEKDLADFIIVFMHMGDENALKANGDQKEWAQFFADNGVGLVIGTHSHSVQPVEVYTGVWGNEMPIFYSLGNFISSQKETVNMLGAMAKATITKDESGTYVSDYTIEPLVTWIQGGSGKGTGYIFHVMHLEDYTDEMGLQHIRSSCMPADFQNVWTQIFETENYYAE